MKIENLNKKIKACQKCPRLSRYIREVAKNKVSDSKMNNTMVDHYQDLEMSRPNYSL